jgi:glyoxylase-like metal-dependent hydrolase (beta-lactamase superfamily II)
MMKTITCSLENIAWAMVTHFHIDHAGLIGEFMDRGIRCLVFENQLEAVDAMERTIDDA